MDIKTRLNNVAEFVMGFVNTLMSDIATDEKLRYFIDNKNQVEQTQAELSGIELSEDASNEQKEMAHKLNSLIIEKLNEYKSEYMEESDKKIKEDGFSISLTDDSIKETLENDQTAKIIADTAQKFGTETQVNYGAVTHVIMTGNGNSVATICISAKDDAEAVSYVNMLADGGSNIIAVFKAEMLPLKKKTVYTI